MALITDMDQPLGEWIGNSTEVLEAVPFFRARDRRTWKSSLSTLPERWFP